MLWLFFFLSVKETPLVCWNVGFGHAADALAPNTPQTERTDGRPSGRARGVGFALGPWESLRLTSPAQGADVTGLNGNRKGGEKGKLAGTTAAHMALCRRAFSFISCLREEKAANGEETFESDSRHKILFFSAGAKGDGLDGFTLIFARLCNPNWNQLILSLLGR